MAHVPEIREKPGPIGVLRWSRRLERFTWTEQFALVSDGSTIELEASWADWDQRGRLVVADRGRLWWANRGVGGVDLTELIDLNDLGPGA